MKNIGTDRTRLLRLGWLSVAILFADPSQAFPQTIDSVTVRVDVPANWRRLIDEEDTDGDHKITVDDRCADGIRGDKRFRLRDKSGAEFEVMGTVPLSNLLQELTLVLESGQKTAVLRYDRIFENPVRRVSRCIREMYWDGLTRRIDGPHLASILTDAKTGSPDARHYLYVPDGDSAAYAHCTRLANERSDLDIEVVRLPKTVTPEWVKSRDGRHGLLSLALAKDHDGRLEGKPYVVPGGRFNEMYGWDSYFEALGLLEDGRVDLARSMVDHFIYEILYYGKILNANRSYYLTRSQPPFLTSMALAVFECLPRSAENEAWLKTAFQAADREYRSVWMGAKRLTSTGLSRYFGEGIGPPPEVEPGHFNAVYAVFAREQGMGVSAFERAYTLGFLRVPALDRFFVHDRAMRESGHDTTYRWEDRCADFATVDLNSLLYKIEADMSHAVQKGLFDEPGSNPARPKPASVWSARAEKRKREMNRFCWDSERGFFFDYDVVNRRRKAYVTPVVFYPLWAGLATREQAHCIVSTALLMLEMPGGLVASTEASRGPLNENRPARQWDYPYGWAPHQMLAWQGLLNYGYAKEARRLAYRWLYTISRNAADYNGTVPEKFDVVKRTHRVFAEYGNVGTDFSYITREGFGWMNASFQVGLRLLTPDLLNALEALVPPEWLFAK